MVVEGGHGGQHISPSQGSNKHLNRTFRYVDRLCILLGVKCARHISEIGKCCECGAADQSYGCEQIDCPASEVHVTVKVYI